ncbi:MAG: 6-bladed beta-propeller, partial [Bradyrhizobiaceae bacterium]|nr:6-bladed beta-propeller [Bradyrhizobiaceae bacterium]
MSNTSRMKLLSGIALVAFAMTAVPGKAQTADPNSAPNAYRPDDSWAKQPMGRGFGMTIGINVDRDGKSMWIFDRCGARTCENSNIAPLNKYDAGGQVVASYLAGMTVFPHGLFVDKDGNVWVTDGQADKDKKIGQDVIKLAPDGKVLMTLGTPGQAGEDATHFNGPSDVIVAANGDIFVADGHGEKTNARIVKFSANGTFIKAWGKQGKGPGEFDTPHGLALDSAGRLFVADRGNNRIQIFDQDGKFLAEWKQFGRPSGVWIDRNDVIYVADSQSNDKVNPGFKQGIRIGDAKDGKV